MTIQELWGITPLSAEDACAELLGLLDSRFSRSGYMGERIVRLEQDGSLSDGERVIVGVASGIWRGFGGAYVGSFGHLDRDNRRAVLRTMLRFYCSLDFPGAPA